MGIALGPRTPGLAHRVLGDVREASSGRSSRSTEAGSTSSSRITRTRSRSPRRSVTPSRRSGCTTGCSTSRARRCRSRVGNSTISLKAALDRWGREALFVFFLSGHWRKPLEYSEDDAGGRAARAEGFRHVVPRRARGGRGGSRERFADALDDDFDAAAAALRRVDARVARARRCCVVRARRVRARRRWPSREEAPADVIALAEQREAAACRARLRRGRSPARRDRGCRVGRARRAPTASGSCVAMTALPRARLRAERRARAVPRARARCSSVGDRSSGRRRSPARARAPRPQVVKPERVLTRRPRARRDHQGVVAWCEPVSATRMRTSSPRGRAAPRVPRPGNGSAQPRRGRSAARRAPARRAVVIPAHGAVRVAPAVCRASGRRGRAHARWPSCRTSRATSRGQERRPLGVRGGRGRGTVSRCGTPTSRAASLSSSEPREGLRPLVRRTCDATVSFPLGGKVYVAERRRSPRPCSSSRAAPAGGSARG